MLALVNGYKHQAVCMHVDAFGHLSCQSSAFTSSPELPAAVILSCIRLRTRKTDGARLLLVHGRMIPHISDDAGCLVDGYLSVMLRSRCYGFSSLPLRPTSLVP